MHNGALFPTSRGPTAHPHQRSIGKQRVVGAHGGARQARPHNLPAHLERWRRQGILSARQVEQILSAARREASTTPLATDAGRQQGSLVVEALGYLGGVLALAAALL